MQQCKSQPHRVRILEKVFLSKVTQSERAKDQRINFTDEHKKIGRHRSVDSSARYILVRIPCTLYWYALFRISNDTTTYSSLICEIDEK